MDSAILSAFSGKPYDARNVSTLQNISVCHVCCVLKSCRCDIISQVGRSSDAQPLSSLILLSPYSHPSFLFSPIISFSPLFLSLFSPLSAPLSLFSLLSSLSYAPQMSLYRSLILFRMCTQMRSQVPKFGTVRIFCLPRPRFHSTIYV